MHPPAGFEARFSEGLQKSLPIRVAAENGFAPVTPIHDMIDRPGILDTQLAGHGEERSESQEKCQ